jgi:hypothetical protein
MNLYLSELESPTVGLEVKSFWQTPGRVVAVREMQPQEHDRWACRDHGQLVIRIDWQGGHFSEAPQSQMDTVRIVN